MTISISFSQVQCPANIIKFCLVQFINKVMFLNIWLNFPTSLQLNPSVALLIIEFNQTPCLLTSLMGFSLIFNRSNWSTRFPYNLLSLWNFIVRFKNKFEIYKPFCMFHNVQQTKQRWFLVETQTPPRVKLLSL